MVRTLSVIRSIDCSKALRDVGVVRREWREFRNGARTDGLKLSHWAKAGTDPDAGPWDLRDLDFWSLTLSPSLPFRALQRCIEPIQVHG